MDSEPRMGVWAQTVKMAPSVPYFGVDIIVPFGAQSKERPGIAAAVATVGKRKYVKRMAACNRKPIQIAMQCRWIVLNAACRIVRWRLDS